MSAGLGLVDVDLFFGRVPNLKPLSDEWHVPGQDGDGIQVLGATADIFEVRTVTFIGNPTTAQGYIAQAEDTQGTLVDVTDAFGVTVANVYVHGVDVNRGNGGTGAIKLVRGVGGYLHRIELFWQLKATE